MGIWEVQKGILGWIINGASQCIQFSKKKQKEIYAELRTIVYIRSDVSYKRFKKLVSGLRDATIGIPQDKSLFGSVNRILAIKSTQIFWNICPEV